MATPVFHVSTRRRISAYMGITYVMHTAYRRPTIVLLTTYLGTTVV